MNTYNVGVGHMYYINYIYTYVVHISDTFIIIIYLFMYTCKFLTYMSFTYKKVF